MSTSVYGIESGLTASYIVDASNTADLSDTTETFIAADVVLSLTEDGMENLFVANTSDGVTTSITISPTVVQDYIFKAFTDATDTTNLIPPQELDVSALQHIASDFGFLSDVHLDKLKYSIVGRTLGHSNLTAFKQATTQYALKDDVVTSLEGFGFFNEVTDTINGAQIYPVDASDIIVDSGSAVNLYSSLADAKLIDIDGNIDLSGAGFGVNVVVTLGFKIETKVDFSADTAGANARVGSLAGNSVEATTLINDDLSSSTENGSSPPTTGLQRLANSNGTTPDGLLTFNLVLDYTPGHQPE